MAEDWITTHPQEFEKGEFITFAIVLKSSNELISAIGLTLHQEHDRAALGYWVGKSYWNQGYCTEATMEAVRYGFEIVSLNHIHAIHLSRNSASGKVMGKIGMRHEGTLRKHTLKWGSRRMWRSLVC